MKYYDLKNLSKNCYLKQQLNDSGRYLKLFINYRERKFKLSFQSKPPRDIRQYLRLYNFKWSRKYKVWISFINGNRKDGVKKIFRYINSHKL